jgi:hypothetical protein
VGWIEKRVGPDDMPAPVPKSKSGNSVACARTAAPSIRLEAAGEAGSSSRRPCGRVMRIVSGDVSKPRGRDVGLFYISRVPELGAAAAVSVKVLIRRELSRSGMERAPDS